MFVYAGHKATLHTNIERQRLSLTWTALETSCPVQNGRISWLFIRFVSILILTSSLLQLFLVTTGLCIQPLYSLVGSSPSTNPLLFICYPYHKVHILTLSSLGKALGGPRLGEKKTDYVSLRSHRQPGRVWFQQGVLKAPHSGSNRRDRYLIFPAVTTWIQPCQRIAQSCG